MDYDIGKAFAAIEEELIASMMRNMKRHRAWEDDEGFQWSMWQAEQLKALEQYKRTNKKKFERQFNEINGSIRTLIEQAREQGSMDQELEILEAIANGWNPPKRISKYMDTSAEFFRLNTRKLEALIKATENDFQRAEVAMLRMADDQYRKVIFNAQVYANTGAGTYEKAVDMATKDYLSRGINCIEYANGARHTMRDYAEMAIRTAAKRAYLAGEGEKRQEWGIHTVIVHKRGNPCPLCLPFVGKVLIDDVWSGGDSVGGQKYPLMSSAIDAGLYHPRCKDTHSTFFPGISDAPNDVFTENEIEQIEKDYTLDQKKNVAKRNYEKYSRLEEHALDEDNKAKYKQKADVWLREFGKHYKQSNHTGSDIKQYNKYRAILGDKIPENIEKFRELKYNNREKWRFIKTDYRRRRALLDEPEKQLPNLDGITVAEEKFTKYLFSEENAKGYAKGKAFTSRLGYNADNWQELKDEIIRNAGDYIATEKGDNGFGMRYEQKMILYGKKGTPANVIVGWIHKPDGTVSMTSAYIKEIKR